MMFPKGNIWQDLRAMALDAIPSETRISYGNPSSLAQWYRTGFYTVTGSNANHYFINASTIDFAGALLGDVEYLLDHAAEQQTTIQQALQSNHWISPAWFVVTCYYWAFFTGLALTRLLGRTLWFIDKSTNRSLKRLAPSGAKHPGAGAFKVLCGQIQSVTDREIIFRKIDSRVHDGLWRILFDICGEMVKKYKITNSSTEEDRIFTALARSADTLGTDWPSALRNAVNYKPGFAYDIVRGKRILGQFSYLASDETISYNDLISRFEQTLVILTGQSNVLNEPKSVSRLLVDLTFLLHTLTNSLHAEIIDRQGFDIRWENSRRLFLQGYGLRLANGYWPC
jgi:hypothetical protein